MLALRYVPHPLVTSPLLGSNRTVYNVHQYGKDLVGTRMDVVTGSNRGAIYIRFHGLLL